MVLEKAELREIQEAARRHRLTVSEWVRQALRSARRAEPRTGTRKKLEVVRAAAKHKFPVADIDQMLAEIEQGYQSDGSR